MTCLRMDAIGVRRRAYYAAHRDEQRAYMAAFREAHREELAARSRAYSAAHRDEIGAKQQEKRREFTEWLQILTSTHTCEMCGGPPDSWHHVDPTTKKANVSRMYLNSLDSIEAELEKCVPLCRSCHTRLHKTRMTT